MNQQEKVFQDTMAIKLPKIMAELEGKDTNEKIDILSHRIAGLESVFQVWKVCLDELADSSEAANKQIYKLMGQTNA